MSILDRLKKVVFFLTDFGGFCVDLRSDDDMCICRTLVEHNVIKNEPQELVLTPSELGDDKGISQNHSPPRFQRLYLCGQIELDLLEGVV